MNEQHILWVLAAATVLLGLQSLVDFSRESKERHSINKRLKVQSETESIAEAVVALRQKQGLDEYGNRKIKNAKLGAFIAKTGLAPQPAMWSLYALAVASGAAGLVLYFTSPLPALAAFFAVLLGGPFLLLNWLGTRRQRQLGLQLPDALDTIVRSLQAGHPVPTAIALVGKETPDPLGTEFGLAADEISFGSSLEQATQKMAERTEHPDIRLFSAIVRLQAKTGGNLGDLLATNARTIRQRQKMRLKVKAASAEGRMSALILTAAPFIVMLGMHFMTPDFYGDVIDNPIIQWGLGIALVWMFIGNAVMRSMVNFKV
ncbi:MAG: type II secretion system F family protein [Hyphomonadaceae bacterium]|nr:type II secretion system F family protein [Hyphomonadaceae bacterium]